MVIFRFMALWCGLMAAIPTLTSAQAFRYQPQSATGAAQSNAMGANPFDASTLHYNAAGMTYLQGIQYSGTIQFVGATIRYQNANGATSRGNLGSTVAWPPPMQMYVAANMGHLGVPHLERLTLGLGINTPYALKTHYQDNVPFNSAVTSAAIPLVNFKPTFAYRVSDSFSVGFGADIMTFAHFLGDGHVEQKSVSSGAGGISGGTALEVNGAGTALGYNVSLLYAPLLNADRKPIATLGFIYRSQATLHLQGQFLANGSLVSDTKATIVLPQSYTGAIAIWPIRDRAREWRIETDFEWIQWSSIQNIDVHLASGTTLPQPTKWRSVPTIAAGTEYTLLQPPYLPHWHVAFRSGYSYTLTQSPMETFNPGTPSMTSHTISVGLGFTCHAEGRFLGLLPCGRRSNSPAWMPYSLGIDLSFQSWFYVPRTITENINPTVNGRYDTSLYLGALGVRAVF